MSLWISDTEPMELRAGALEEDLQTVIRAVYKQVLGNAHLMASESFTSAESQLRNGDITVREFVRTIAKSGLYQSLYFHSCPQYRFIELNFKHLLGRAPQDQSEVSEHVQTYADGGYDAEIDSYIDSNEYLENFGENIVPYPRSTVSQVGIKNDAFNRTFALYRGYATSDRDNSAKLINSIAGNSATPIKTPAKGNGANYANTGKRFRVSVAKGGVTPRYKRSNFSFEVGYEQLSARIQAIHKTGGKIVSVTEVA